MLDFHHHHHHDNKPVMDLLNRLFHQMENLIMASQSDIVAEIKAAKDEIATAVKSLSDQLAAAIAKQSDVSPDLQSAADDLKSFADGLTPPVVPPAA